MSNPNYRTRAELLAACRHRYAATFQKINDAVMADADLANDGEVTKLLEIMSIGLEEQFLEDVVRMDFAMQRGVKLKSSLMVGA
jgi:hypothetical protein